MLARNRKCWLGIALIFCGFAPVAHASTKQVLNDWFALGSGCRAKSDLPGNVRVEGVPAEAGAPDSYKVKFLFTDLALRGETADPTLKKFGRECAVRLNINPPEGKKIVSIRAKTRITASKETGPALDILSELKLGAASIGKIQRKLDHGARVAAREDEIDLEAGQGTSEPLPQLGCGEPKIIGFDYSWIATREKDQKGTLLVALGKEKSLVIEATLASCN